jgi:hypothetical protein
MLERYFHLFSKYICINLFICSLFKDALPVYLYSIEKYKG